MIGLTALIILLLVSVLLPIGNVIEETRWMRDMAEQGIHYTQNVRLLDLLDINPLLLGSFCTATPLLLLYMFGFLTKRNACDFYHAIPQTRTCVFLSFFGAAMTWVLIYTVVPALMGAGLSAMFPAFFRVNWGNVLQVLFNIFAANLFVGASIAIAVSLTGTTFTNIVVSGIIIFVPRIFLTVVTVLVTEALPFVPSGYLFPLLDAKYNVVFGMFAGFLIGSEGALTELGSGLYTLVLGLIYTGAATYLFNWRRSEAAGQAAASSKLQLVYRLIVSMLICLIPCAFIYSGIIRQEHYSISEIYVFFVMYVIAVVAYFLYELITTRKWRNLVKAAPGLGILVLLNVVLIGGMCLLHSVTLNTTPDADDIKSIQIVNSDSPTNFPDGLLEDYFAAKTNEVKLTDEAARTLISERLKEQVDLWQFNQQNYYQKFDRMDQILVKINTGLRSIYRLIYLDEQGWELMGEVLESQDAFQSAYKDLPALGTNATAVSVDDLGTEAGERVYEALRAELANMDFGEWYNLAEGSLYGDNVLTRVTFATAIGSKTYASAVAVTADMPQTAQTFMEAYNAENAKYKETLRDFLENWEETDYEYMYLNIKPYQAGLDLEENYLYGKQGVEDVIYEYRNRWFYEGSEGQIYINDSNIAWEDTVELLLANIDKPIDSNGMYAYVRLDMETVDEKGEWSTTGAYCFVSLDGAEKLLN